MPSKKIILMVSIGALLMGCVSACVDDKREDPNSDDPGMTAGGLDQDGVPDDRDDCPGVWNPATYSLGDVEQDGNVTIDVTCEDDSECEGIWVIETPHGTDGALVESAVYSVCGDGGYCMVQPDYEWDGIGDACDDDRDNDGVVNDLDNCDYFWNPDQKNHDGDAMGDACDGNDDGDWVPDEEDNCPFVDNPDQMNTDSYNGDDNITEVKVGGDDMGDACDPDDDNDGVADPEDNCRLWPNEDQLDQDGDGDGDACDLDCDNDGIDEVDHLPNWVCAVTDFDGDGYDWDEECNDGNAWVHPGATEVCGDLIDNDCNGMTDAADGDACDCVDNSDCNDFNPCTDDWCDFEDDNETSGTCQHEGDCTDDSCVDNSDCNDGNSCTDDSCVNNSCQHTNNTAPCADGDTCDGAEVCSGGVCPAAGTPMNCDDGNPCTNDGCSANACTHANNTAPCQDNLWCNGADTCGGGTCSVHAGNPCVGQDTGDNCADSCNEDADMCNANDMAHACNDGNSCTTSDTCSSGQCVGTAVQNCGACNGVTCDQGDSCQGEDEQQCVGANEALWCWDDGQPPSCEAGNQSGPDYFAPNLWKFSSNPSTPPACTGPTSDHFPVNPACCVSASAGWNGCGTNPVVHPYN